MIVLTMSEADIGRIAGRRLNGRPACRDGIQTSYSSGQKGERQKGLRPAKSHVPCRG